MNLRTLWLWLCFTAFFQAYGQDYFSDASLQSLKKTAQAKGKPIFCFIQASWCPHCHVMRDQLLPDEEVKAALLSGFILAKIDGENQEGKAIMARYGQSSFPAFLILDDEGELLYGFGGELKKPDFLREINIAITPSQQLPALRSAFEADTANGEKCLQYVQTLRKARQDASDVAYRYFKNVPDQRIASKTNWMIIANAIHDVDSREIRYVLGHKDEFAAVSSEKRVNRKLVNLAQETLRPAMDNRDSASYKSARLKAQRIATYSADSLIFAYDLRFFETMKSWKEYAKTLDQAKRFIWSDPKKLKDAADVLLKNAADSTLFDTALELAFRALELKESYDGYLLVAKLHEKRNDKTRATEFAQKARDFATKLKFGTKEADEILSRNS